MVACKIADVAPISTWLHDAEKNHRTESQAWYRCTAVYRRIVAVGTSSGVTFVLMPRGIGTEGGKG